LRSRDMRRRNFIRLVGGAAVAWPIRVWAQQPKRPRLGVLLVANREPFWSLFREGLADLGYTEGSNIEIAVRSGDGQIGHLPALAAELVRLKVDIIVASETPAVNAAKKATNEIPIVMAPSGDPVGTGLIASLARPGGNVTGLSAATAELAGKSLELVREISPLAKRVAALADPNNSFTKPFLEQILLFAKSSGIDVRPVMVRGIDDFDAAFAEMMKERVDAVIVQPTLPRQKAIDLALKYRLLSVSGNKVFAESGGLLSYSASANDRYRGAAAYVDKILKGAKPADLPVQQPTRFELVINLKTAKALGLEVPDKLLAIADEVIE
jgi:putative tryptophan/tyrosine transport system substrate-binding protein